MSPVSSSTAPNAFVRRHSAEQTALFPANPDEHGPNPLTGDDVTGGSRPSAEPDVAAGLSDSKPGCPTADCPPPSQATGGAPRRPESRIRNAEAQLAGIARLAANSPAAESCRTSAERPEYFVLPVKSILNKCDSKRVPFEWTINPYRGCEFGCKYCYARYTHEYMELDGAEFEKKIFVKDAGPALLGAEVDRKYSYQRKNAEPGVAEHIAIGTATDPYQPAEKEYGVTRRCLEELAKREGLSVSVITKSNQIVRDIEVLKRIAEKSELTISITITTLRARLARLLEPRAPRPDLRLEGVRQLREAGLTVGVSASPLIPGITDGVGELEEVGAAAKEAGALFFFSGVLFLMPASAKQFLPFIREKFPRLAKQYEEWYSKNGYAPESYRQKMAERVKRLKQVYGFADWRPRMAARHGRCAQLSLELNTAA